MTIRESLGCFRNKKLLVLSIVRTEIITLLLQDVGNEEVQSLVRNILIKEA